jgi:transposase
MEVSQRRACRVVGQARSTQRYVARRADRDRPLVQRMRELAGRHPRYGYRRVAAMLRREGWRVNRLSVYWLPPYCPSLNLIERLWGHLKRTVLANVLFKTLDDLVQAFRRGVARINGRRNRMAFMFRHDDAEQEAA